MCVKILELVLVAEVNIENICLFFVNFACLIRNSLMVLIAKCVEKGNH